MDEIELLEVIKKAYKKLKASVFYDKTTLELRNKIVCFEDKDFYSRLYKLSCALNNDKEWESYEKKILDSIGILPFPKKLKMNDSNVVCSVNSTNKIEVDKLQYFLDMNVIGHILGVMWILLVGKNLDNADSMYQHSYGNRLRKNLFDKYGNFSYFPSLFQPYFSQYEKWRDKGLEAAKDCLKDDNDVVILTMDFQSYYYSVNYTEKDFEKFIDHTDDKIIKKVNEFVYNVLKTYSEKLYEYSKDKNLFKYEQEERKENSVLPIGFLPSNILANWRLREFDEKIIERWNPLYYGRYVDDIILVDKVDKTSYIHKQVEENKCTSDVIIKYYFGQCNADKNSVCAAKDSRELLKIEKIPNEELSRNDCSGGEKIEYYINPYYLNNNDSRIRVQDTKVKVFYFKSNATNALISCFQKEISENASEFRYLPELSSITDSVRYDKIFDLERDDTLNKLSAIKTFTLNKFELSKFLGKYMSIAAMTRYTNDIKVENELLKIFDKIVLIDQYSVWEKLFELFVIKENHEAYKKLFHEIIDAIDCIEVGEDIVNDEINHNLYKKSLYLHLYSCVYRTLSLTWGPLINKLVDDLCLLLQETYSQNAFDKEIINKYRKLYCKTRMVNKYSMPVNIDFIIYNSESWMDDKIKFNLFDLNDIMVYIKKNDEKYFFHPYTVTPQEIIYSNQCCNLKNANDEISYEDVHGEYYALNYNLLDVKDKHNNFIIEQSKEKNYKYIYINSEHADKLRIAIGNVRVYEEDFKNVLTLNQHCSLDKYNQFEKILREALKEKVDLLVFPESFLPFSWLPRVSRFCAQNQIGLITGIEHFITIKEHVPIIPITPNNSECIVHNLTAVILPYKLDEFKYSYLKLHEKIDYSPEEIRQITGYGYSYQKGKNLHLFCWRDVWFPVFCCFELASITNRAMFTNIPDLFIAVECNKDTIYYSNIIESLCRDIHCYCVQVNSSNYGDSRVVQPTKSENMNIIRTKGGINYTILVDDIDIKALRDYQLKEYELQKEDNRFKPTPPRFDKSIVFKKIKNVLNDIIN